MKQDGFTWQKTTVAHDKEKRFKMTNDGFL